MQLYRFQAKYDNNRGQFNSILKVPKWKMLLTKRIPQLPEN